MAGELNWAERLVNALVGLIGRQPVFSNDSAPTTTMPSIPVKDVYAVREDFSPPQGSENPEVHGVSNAYHGDTFSDFSDVSSMSSNNDDGNTSLQQIAAEFPTAPQEDLNAIVTRLQTQKLQTPNSSLSDKDIKDIYLAILEEKQANPRGSNGVIQKKLFQALETLNLSEESLQALLNKINTEKQKLENNQLEADPLEKAIFDLLGYLVAPLTQTINDYEEKERKSQMCQDIYTAFQNSSTDRPHTVLDKIYEVIEQEITEQRPISTLREALEEITLSKAYSVDSKNFMLDPELHTKTSTLQCEDLKYLVNKSLQLTDDQELNKKMRTLSNNIVTWLEKTEDIKFQIEKTFMNPLIRLN